VKVLGLDHIYGYVIRLVAAEADLSDLGVEPSSQVVYSECASIYEGIEGLVVKDDMG
jgi:hypothetical protein